MRLSRERKLYVSVFGLGLLALAADRLWFTPAQADAASPPTAEAAALPPVPAADPAPPQSFAARLSAAAQWEEGPLREALAAPAAWPAASLPEAQTPPAIPPVPFDQKHRVSAISRVGDQAAVFVDGHLLKVGETVDGFTLEAITGPKTAIFERDGQTCTVTVGDRAEGHKADKTAR